MKKLMIKTLALLIITLLAFPAVSFASVKRKLQGAGTFDNPFQVSTSEDFANMGGGVQMSKDFYFILMNDITITSGISNFAGVFYGDGHTIFVDIHEKSGGSAAAPFTSTDSRAVIANVHVAGTVRHSKGGNAGGLVGNNSGVIINSTSSVNVTGASGEIGGLVGNNKKFGLIINSHASGDILGSSNVGGLVGNNDGQIILSSASGNASGNYNVGSLVGTNNKQKSNISLVQQSHATGSATFASDNPPHKKDGQNIGVVVGVNTGTISYEPVDLFEVLKASIPDTSRLAFALGYPQEAAKAKAEAAKKAREEHAAKMQKFIEELEIEMNEKLARGEIVKTRSYERPNKTTTNNHRDYNYELDGGFSPSVLDLIDHPMWNMDETNTDTGSRNSFVWNGFVEVSKFLHKIPVNKKLQEKQGLRGLGWEVIAYELADEFDWWTFDLASVMGGIIADYGIDAGRDYARKVLGNKFTPEVEHAFDYVFTRLKKT